MAGFGSGSAPGQAAGDFVHQQAGQLALAGRLQPGGQFGDARFVNQQERVVIAPESGGADVARQQRHAAASAENAAAIEQQMLNRYRAGLVAYTEVVTAQASALTARRSLMQLQLQRQQAAIALIQALGGGWQTPQQAPQQTP